VANEFVYRVGADSTELERAFAGAEGSLDRLDRAFGELQLRLQAIAGATGNAARQQRDQLTAAQAFVASVERQNTALRAQVEAYGQTEAQALRARAAQLGVSQQTDATITSIERLTAAQRAQQQATQRSIAIERAMANIRASARAVPQGPAEDVRAVAAKREFIELLQREAAAVGKTRAELLQMKAATLGVSQAAAPLIAQLRAGQGGGLFGGLGGLGPLVGLGAGIIALRQAVTIVADLNRGLIEAQTTADRLRLQFTAGFGADKASAELEFAREVANRFGLELNGVAAQYAKFAAATRGTSLEGRATREVFLSVAQSAAALGLNVEEVEGILRAMGQMASKGRVQMEELSGQLGDRLVGALNKAARAMGVTTGELVNMVQAGQVLPTELLPRLAAVLRDDLGGAADEASGRMDAFVKRFENAKALLAQDIAASGFGDFNRTQLEALSRDLGAVSEAYRQAREEGAGFIGQTAAGLQALFAPGTVRTYAERIEEAKRKLQELRAEQSASPGLTWIAGLISETETLIARLDLLKGKRENAQGLGGAGGGRGDGSIQIADFRKNEEARGRRMTAIAEVTEHATAANDKYVKSIAALQTSLLAGDFAGREGEYVKLATALAEREFKPKRGGKGEADAVLKRETQNRIQAIQAGVERELDLLDFAGDQARGRYDDSLVDLRSYHAEKATLARQALATQQAAIAQELVALRNQRDSAISPQTRLDAEGKIAEAVSRRARVEREASQAAIEQAQEEARARKALTDQVLGFESQLLAAQGRELQAREIEDARRVRDASELLRRDGRSDAGAQQLAQVLERSRVLEEAQRRLARVSQAAALAEEDYMLTATQAGYAREQVEADVLRIRQQALGQLRELTAAVQALAAVSDDPRLTLYARELQLQLRKAEEAVDPLRQRLEGVADNIGQSVGQNISDALMQNDWKAAGKRIVGDLGSALAEEAFLQPVRQLATNFLRSGISGAGGVGDMLTNALGRMLGIGKPAGTAIDPAAAALSAAKAA
jgi:tape measure domain-containing protein